MDRVHVDAIAVHRACPDCRKWGGLTLSEVLEAKSIGDFSLAGAQVKFSAQKRWRLACSICGFGVIGHIEGDDFVVP